MPKEQNRYDALIVRIFLDHYKSGITHFEFDREELVKTAKALGIVPPKNLGDILYSFRFRAETPKEISSRAPKGKEWIIRLAGRAKYRFFLSEHNRILPRDNLVTINIPDATPEIISRYALTDEQALLAKVRYNRLVDVFLGLAAYSLQNHLRTFVKDLGQIEVDELYVGINNSGAQFILPVQAKGGKDKLGAVQILQDWEFCAKRFPNLVCRPIATQFMGKDRIVMFEMTIEGDDVKIVDEKHYRLVPADQISDEDLRAYRSGKAV